MRRVKTTGHTRMKELGYKRLDVWLTKEQMEALAELADELGLPITRVARRAINHIVKEGITKAYVLRSGTYD